MSLREKINEAAISIGKVEKNGVNTHFKFKYQAWDDVVPAVRDACADAGIVIIPSIEDVQVNPGHVVIKMTFTVTDGDEKYDFTWWGEAKGNDDKNIQKAATSATKYAYLKLFLIPVEGEDVDPDAHKGTVNPQELDYTLPAVASKEMVEAQSRRILLDVFGGRDNADVIKNLCKEKGIKPVDIAYEAYTEGVRDYDGFHAFITSYVKENK